MKKSINLTHKQDILACIQYKPVVPNLFRLAAPYKTEI